MKAKTITCGLLIAISLNGLTLTQCAAQTANNAEATKRVVSAFAMPTIEMAQSKARLANGDTELQSAFMRLVEDANKALKVKPMSVMDKTLTPDSGDKHDYMSIAPYWWPNPNTPDGMPYIRKDGKVNPEYHSDATDFDSLQKMTKTVSSLTLAYYFTGKENYADHAAKMLRAWFLAPQTRMNPSVNYGQAVPSQNMGRPAGLIETARWSGMVELLPLLESSPSWTADDKRGLQKWFGELADWALTSEIGQKEGRSNNNHGTWYDVQIARFALYAGKPEVARRVLERVAPNRIDRQITAEGKQPAELGRTKSWNYSSMNLRAFFELAVMADGMGIDLWNYEGAKGQSLRVALDYIAPYADPADPWPHEQIARMDMSHTLLPLLRRGAHYYDEPRYEQLIGKMTEDDIASDRLQLMVPRAKAQ